MGGAFFVGGKATLASVAATRTTAVQVCRRGHTVHACDEQLAGPTEPLYSSSQSYDKSSWPYDILTAPFCSFAVGWRGLRLRRLHGHQHDNHTHQRWPGEASLCAAWRLSAVERCTRTASDGALLVCRL